MAVKPFLTEPAVARLPENPGTKTEASFIAEPQKVCPGNPFFRAHLFPLHSFVIV